MTRNEERLNRLILCISREVDFWLLEDTKSKRIQKYGLEAYEIIAKRMTKLRNEIIPVILKIEPERDKTVSASANIES